MLRLRLEFWALFLVAPIAIAILLPPVRMFPALMTLTVLGLILLHRTHGFDWRELSTGWRRIDWRFVAAASSGTLLTGALVLWSTRPEAAFGLWRVDPRLFLGVMLLYPVLSALPQELVFRPLFFRRYGPILPGGAAAIWLNATLFSLAHLMYWSIVVAAMTFCGGLIFAWSYRTRGFPEALVIHAIAGNLLFAIGMGVYFYSGAVEKPF